MIIKTPFFLIFKFSKSPIFQYLNLPCSKRHFFNCIKMELTIHLSFNEISFDVSSFDIKPGNKLVDDFISSMRNANPNNSDTAQTPNELKIDLQITDSDITTIKKVLKNEKVRFNRLNIDFLINLATKLQNDKLLESADSFKKYLNNIKIRFNESQEFAELLCSEIIAFNVDESNKDDYLAAALALSSRYPRQFVRVLFNAFFIRNNKIRFLVDFVKGMKSDEIECYLQGQFNRQIKVFTTDEMKQKSFTSLAIEIPSFFEFVTNSLCSSKPFETNETFINKDQIAQYIINDDVNSLKSVVNSNVNQKIELNANDRCVFPKKDHKMKLSQNQNNNPTLSEYAAFYGSSKCFDYLMQEAGAKCTKNLGKYAICGGDEKILLFCNIEETSEEKQWNDAKKLSYLELAIKHHRSEVFIKLFEKFIINSNIDIELLSLKAIRYSSFRILRYLIEFGADISRGMMNQSLKTDLQSLFIFLMGIDGIDFKYQDDADFTPLHCAIRAGNTEAVQLILRYKGNEIDVNQGDHCGRTPIQFACIMGKTNILKMLIKFPGAQINKLDDEGMNALHYASKHGNADVVKLLLDQNCDVNVKNSAFMTPLHYACQQGKLNVVKMLLDVNDIKVNLHDIGGWTPLHYAVENRYFPIVEALLKHPEIDPNVVESTVFLIYL